MKMNKQLFTMTTLMCLITTTRTLPMARFVRAAEKAFHHKYAPLASLSIFGAATYVPELRNRKNIQADMPQTKRTDVIIQHMANIQHQAEKKSPLYRFHMQEVANAYTTKNYTQFLNMKYRTRGIISAEHDQINSTNFAFVASVFNPQKDNSLISQDFTPLSWWQKAFNTQKIEQSIDDRSSTCTKVSPTEITCRTTMPLHKFHKRYTAALAALKQTDEKEHQRKFGNPLTFEEEVNLVRVLTF